jgi:PhnB protein
MATLNPYLMFDGDARAALEFYRAVFGGQLNVMTYGDMGAAEHEGTALPADNVMHGQLETDLGFTLMGSDLPPGTPLPGNGHVSLSGDEADTLGGYFQALAEGGDVEVPLGKQVWGDQFGQVKDKFGVSWLVNISGS